MAEFGEDFDFDSFQHAYDSDDPLLLNQVKAVERGVDQLCNYIAELSAFGLELAEIRTRHQDTNARADIESLRRIGVIGPERARRLQRLRELRRLLVHEYATATAAQVHESARIISSEFIPFYDAYRNWIITRWPNVAGRSLAGRVSSVVREGRGAPPPIRSRRARSRPRPAA